MTIVYKSNGQTVGDGIRITRVSNGGQTLEVLTDNKTETYSEIVLKADTAPEPPVVDPDPTPTLPPAQPIPAPTPDPNSVDFADLPTAVAAANYGETVKVKGGDIGADLVMTARPGGTWDGTNWLTILVDPGTPFARIRKLENRIPGVRFERFHSVVPSGGVGVDNGVAGTMVTLKATTWLHDCMISAVGEDGSGAAMTGAAGTLGVEDFNWNVGLRIEADGCEVTGSAIADCRTGIMVGAYKGRAQNVYLGKNDLLRIGSDYLYFSDGANVSGATVDSNYFGENVRMRFIEPIASMNGADVTLQNMQFVSDGRLFALYERLVIDGAAGLDPSLWNVPTWATARTGATLTLANMPWLGGTGGRLIFGHREHVDAIQFGQTNFVQGYQDDITIVDNVVADGPGLATGFEGTQGWYAGAPSPAGTRSNWTIARNTILGNYGKAISIHSLADSLVEGNNCAPVIPDKAFRFPPTNQRPGLNFVDIEAPGNQNVVYSNNIANYGPVGDGTNRYLQIDDADTTNSAAKLRAVFADPFVNGREATSYGDVQRRYARI